MPVPVGPQHIVKEFLDKVVAPLFKITGHDVGVVDDSLLALPKGYPFVLVYGLPIGQSVEVGPVEIGIAEGGEEGWAGSD